MQPENYIWHLQPPLLFNRKPRTWTISVVKYKVTNHITMNSQILKLLIEDIRLVLKGQPGLRCTTIKEVPSTIEGTYEVRDDHGDIQGDFEIRVQIPLSYPYGFPTLWEI